LDPTGGVARRAAYIKEQRKRYPNLLVLDAGDSLIKDQPPAIETQGASSIEAMNAMGYDAMALGEGDLAQLGVEGILRRAQEAQFPFLSANAYLTGTEDLLVAPYIVLNVGSRHVAIVGITGPANNAEVEIRDPLEAARATIAQVRDQADILILLSHVGLEANREIARALPEIDLIVSGGGNEITRQLEGTDNGPFIVQADLPSPGHAGRRIGAGSWVFDRENTIVGQQWENIAFTTAYPDDPDMQAWVLKYQPQQP
jgi:5'-nucleotidase/UDP-sugar diphosphatase